MQQRSLLLRRNILLLLSAAAFNLLVYYGGRLAASNLKHHSLATMLDAQIPFLPWTILVYLGCYLFWIVNYFIGTKYDKGSGYRFLGAHFIGETICFLCFVIFPTTMARPECLGVSISEHMIRMTYSCDVADNLFPSIHCFVSWLCWIGVRKNKHIPVWYRAVSLLIAVLVCISTLTVKQHVIVDVPAGIILAELSYVLSGTLEKHCKKKPEQEKSCTNAVRKKESQDESITGN